MRRSGSASTSTTRSPSCAALELASRGWDVWFYEDIPVRAEAGRPRRAVGGNRQLRLTSSRWRASRRDRPGKQKIDAIHALSLTAGDRLSAIRRRRHDAGRNQPGALRLRRASVGRRHACRAVLAHLSVASAAGRELTTGVRSARVYVLRWRGPDHGGRERNPPRIPACGSPLDPVGDVHPGTRPTGPRAQRANVGSRRYHVRVAGGGSAVTLQRDAAEVHAFRHAARALPPRTGSRPGAKACRTPLTLSAKRR